MVLFIYITKIRELRRRPSLPSPQPVYNNRWKKGTAMKKMLLVASLLILFTSPVLAENSESVVEEYMEEYMRDVQKMQQGDPALIELNNSFVRAIELRRKQE